MSFEPLNIWCRWPGYVEEEKAPSFFCRKGAKIARGLYHVVWIPKCRRKVLFEQLRKNLGKVFRELARQRESDILEGHLMPDHVHMLISHVAEHIAPAA